MRYVVDGREVECRTALDLVRYMHGTSHSPASTNEEWMREVAERTVTQMGVEIRHDSVKSFVEDLVRYGLIEMAQEGPNG